MFRVELNQLGTAVPETILQLAVFVVNTAISVLLAFVPSSRVRTLVWHHINSVSLPLVKLVESFIAAAICVVLNAKAIDFLVDPVTCELASVSPLVGSETLN